MWRERDDLELAEAVRSGSSDAFRALYERHRALAERIAQDHVGEDAVDDVVSEAFLGVYAQLRAGKGPTQDFRAYLRRTLIHEASDRLREGRRARPDPRVDTMAEPAPDHAAPWFESTTIARAYRSLPRRWRRVLWLIDVEGRPVREVARLEGVSPTRISGVAYRARKGLRTAYLTACLSSSGDAPSECRAIRRLLPDAIRGELSPRRRQRVDEHLKQCEACRAVRAELVSLDQQLDAWLLPVAGVAGGVTAAGATLAGTGIASGVLGVITLPLLGSVTAGIVVGGTLLTSPPDPAEGPPQGAHRAAEPLVPRAPTTQQPDERAAAQGDLSPTDAAAQPVTPSPPAAVGDDHDLGAWASRPPRAGDRVPNGGERFLVSTVSRDERSKTSPESPVDPPSEQPAPGTTVWVSERTETTVLHYTIDLELEDEEDRYYEECDGSIRERGMRMQVIETRVVVHRTGYRVNDDGSRTPVQDSEEIERSLVFGGLLTDPPVACPPPPEEIPGDDITDAPPVPSPA